MLRAVAASLSLLLSQSTAGQVGLVPVPWTTAEIASEGPLPPDINDYTLFLPGFTRQAPGPAVPSS